MKSGLMMPFTSAISKYEPTQIGRPTLRLRDTEVGVVSGQDGPTLGGCVR